MLDTLTLTGRSIVSHFDPSEDAPMIAGCTIKRIDGLISLGGEHSGAIYDDSETHRYALWRTWAPGILPLVVIGLNPSTATESVLDNTVRRDLDYARQWGFGGLVKLNLFSYRGTDPRVLYAWVKEHGEVNPDPLTGGVMNNNWLDWFTNGKRAGLVLAAWGNHGRLLSRGSRVYDLLTRAGVKLFALKVTDLGQPQHTLYLPKHLTPQPYFIR